MQLLSNKCAYSHIIFVKENVICYFCFRKCIGKEMLEIAM